MLIQLMKELSHASKRINNLRAFVIHKIKKGKARFTNLVHRIEDWIVETIKYESDYMYTYAKRTKEAIINVKILQDCF